MKTDIALALSSLALCCASAAHADTFGSGGNQFAIEFVTIGNPGDPADTTGNPNPAGSVGYVYRPEPSAADFNSDGDVDGDDFLTWQASFGVDAGGDADGDGDSDGYDLLIWQI